MPISFSINSISLKDDQIFDLDPGGVLVIVGPNNVGKSAMLRGIKSQLYGNNQGGTEIVSGLALSGSGDENSFREWVEENLAKTDNHGEITYSWYSEPFAVRGEPVLTWQHRFQNQSVGVSWHHLTEGWAAKESGLIQYLAPFFCSLANTDTRLMVASTAPPDNPHIGPHHPVHVLRRDPTIETSVSEAFRLAFSTDLILRDGGGEGLSLHCGDRSKIDPETIQRDKHGVWNIPALEQQGDGMRSFAACLLLFFTSPGFVQLLDEPEVFLHPWHARLLARILVTQKKPSTQLIMTTHRGDFLRGVLDANPPGLRVIRINRDGSRNRASSLDAEQIRDLWENPVLHYSNALDGLFHRSVVICEHEADCRFYSAMADAVMKDNIDRPDEDTMYIACAGKTRIWIVAAALKRLEVQTRVVADFDVLNDEMTMRRIVEALGGCWGDYVRDWKLIKTTLDQKNPPIKISQVTAQISEVLDAEQGSILTKPAAERIRRVLNATSPWQAAKESGKRSLPNGQPYQAMERLLLNLMQLGLFVVECGELERFEPSIEGKGSSWVAAMLENRDLARAPELEEARRFVHNLVSSLARVRD